MTYILILAAIVLVAAFSKPQTHTYTAQFGNAWQQGLSQFNQGFNVTGTKALSKNASFTNCALFGPTGSGKTSTVILSSIVSLAKGKSSMVLNDVSGELYTHTSTFLNRQGYRIIRVDFSNSASSETFNPLHGLRTIAEIQKVALLIVRNATGESKGDVFWEQSSIMLISLFARYLIFHTEPQFHTLQNVLRLIEKFAVDGAAVDVLLARTGDEELLSAYKATIVMGDKTLQSVIATARTSLSLFCDPEVCKTTFENSIDVNLLRKEPTAIFICNPLKDLLYFKPLSALFIQSLFNYTLSHIPNKNERSIFFIIDEAATFRFPNLSTTISNIRKYDAGILLCMQDEQSLIAQYGQAEAHQIKTNCGCQIYMKGQPMHTCKELSQLLGKYTYKDEKEIERSRELMTPDEIHLSDDAIILIGNKAPLKCTMIPYYENMWISKSLSQPPLEYSTDTVVDPPLLPFYK